jgi:hypothetical protein
VCDYLPRTDVWNEEHRASEPWQLLSLDLRFRSTLLRGVAGRVLEDQDGRGAAWSRFNGGAIKSAGWKTKMFKKSVSTTMEPLIATMETGVLQLTSRRSVKGWLAGWLRVYRNKRSLRRRRPVVEAV